MNKTKIDPNLLIAIGVLIASFLALFVYVRQASIMHEQTEILLQQTKANAWPNLTIGMGRSVSESENNLEVKDYHFAISNRGMGPAIIEQIRILYDGEPARNWKHFFDIIKVPEGMGKTHSNAILSDMVVRANQDLPFISWPDSPDLREYIYRLSDKISMEICYSSVHSDSWLVSRHGFQTNLELISREKVAACDLPAKDLFLE